ncbi:MAG: hypothetical protein ACRC8D_07115 [Aeromonas sp.]
MKKTMLVSFLALALTACAVPQEMRDNQKQELKALHEYHQAERTAYRAGEIKDTADTAKTLATGVKVLAELEVKRAKGALDDALNQ